MARLTAKLPPTEWPPAAILLRVDTPGRAANGRPPRRRPAGRGTCSPASAENPAPAHGCPLRWRGGRRPCGRSTSRTRPFPLRGSTAGRSRHRTRPGCTTARGRRRIDFGVCDSLRLLADSVGHRVGDVPDRVQPQGLVGVPFAGGCGTPWPAGPTPYSPWLLLPLTAADWGRVAYTVTGRLSKALIKLFSPRTAPPSSIVSTCVIRAFSTACDKSRARPCPAHACIP